MAKKEQFKLKQVEAALIATKGLMSLAAERLGCSRECVRGYTIRHPELGVVRDEARSKLVDTAELALESAVLDKAGWAVCFTLKTLGKDRGFVERRELTGEDGGPIQAVAKVVLIPPKLDEEEWKQLANPK